MTEYERLLKMAARPRLTILRASEELVRYNVLTIRHMQVMWLEQNYFSNLTTETGAFIQVLSPGIWNEGAGPDFLKARIRIGGQELCGDIELHLAEEDWYAHEHHRDERYDNVLLQICYRKPSDHRRLLTSKGREVNSASLHQKLTISESKILKLIDLDLYPYRQFAGSGRCSKSLFSELSQDSRFSLFRSAALWRLKDKWDKLQDPEVDAPLRLMAGIATTLGYGRNGEAFRKIFQRLVKSGLDNENHLLALAMSITGFFSPYFIEKWGDSPLYLQLHMTSKTLLQKSAHPEIVLKLNGIRPANHPVRRLAAMAKLIAREKGGHIEKKLLSLWDGGWQEGVATRWKKFKPALMALIPDVEDPYWSSRYLFETGQQSNKIALIGGDLKREIAFNVILPYLHHHLQHRGHIYELEAFSKLYSSFPISRTGKSSYLEHRFFGDNSVDSLLLKADIQQGAYQIHRDFCVHYEASCNGCPFVERYQEAFGNKFDSSLYSREF